MNIGIAGAGLIGRLLAWRCVQQGHQVTLFDSDDYTGKQSCAYAAAGMIAPLAELMNAEVIIYQWGMRSLQLWPTILHKLAQAVTYQQQGCLLMADQARQLSFVQQVLNKKLQQPAHLQQLNAEAIAKLEPELTNYQQALFFPDHAYIDNKALLNALMKALQCSAVTWRTKQAVEHCYPYRLISQNKMYHFDLVCDCRGLGAQRDWPELRAVRGELIYLHAPQVTIHRSIRLLHPRYPVYIVPRVNNYYLIGASQIESHDHSTISVRSCLELLTAAFSLHPGFAEARIINTVVNCRPAFPDNLPRLETQAGLLRINGLYRHGFLVGPSLIEQAMEFIDDYRCSE